MSNAKKKKGERCTEHNISILYYCVDCNESLCSDCYMFGKKHKEHEISKLDQIYSLHVENIQIESREVQKKYDILNSFLKSINEKIISVGSYKLEKGNELEELFDNLKSKLENKVHLKLTKLMSCKNEISDKLKFLENVKLNIDKELSDAPKSVLITKSAELINNLKNLHLETETLESHFTENVNMNTSSEIASDVLPHYESSTFEIADYRKLISLIQNDYAGLEINSNVYKLHKEKEFIYSHELVTNGLVWRIKVYPYGNSGARGDYLSIFLELIEGLLETSKYYYKIELCNFLPSNSDRRYANHSREFSSDFSNGECWGYNRFYKIENLDREGFVENEAGKIKIKFHVRPQTYSQLCRDQKNYIATLERRLKFYSSKSKVEANILKIENEGKEELNKKSEEVIATTALANQNVHPESSQVNNKEEINTKEEEYNSNSIIEEAKIFNEINFNCDKEESTRPNEAIPQTSDIGSGNKILIEKDVNNVLDNTKRDSEVNVNEVDNRNIFNANCLMPIQPAEDEGKFFSNLNKINNAKFPDKTHNLNLDLYDPDLSLDNSTKEILQGNFENFINERKDRSHSDEGSSFNSIIDSIKIMEESSNQSNLKPSNNIEKEVDSFTTEKYKKYNLSSDGNYFKNLNTKIEKELRTSSDKFNDIINNLYPDNSQKSQKSNYRKYIQPNFPTKSLSNKYNSYKINSHISNPPDNHTATNDEELKNKSIKSKTSLKK